MSSRTRLGNGAGQAHGRDSEQQCPCRAGEPGSTISCIIGVADSFGAPGRSALPSSKHACAVNTPSGTVSVSQQEQSQEKTSIQGSNVKYHIACTQWFQEISKSGRVYHDRSARLPMWQVAGGRHAASGLSLTHLIVRPRAAHGSGSSHGKGWSAGVPSQRLQNLDLGGHLRPGACAHWGPVVHVVWHRVRRNCRAIACVCRRKDSDESATREGITTGPAHALLGPLRPVTTF